MNSVRVEVDVCSGRPNPTWGLTAEEARFFIERRDALPILQGANVDSLEPVGLGYRGLSVEEISEQGLSRISISRGKLIFETEGFNKRPQLKDSERWLEKWLLTTGRHQMGEDLFQYLLNETTKRNGEK